MRGNTQQTQFYTSAAEGHERLHVAEAADLTVPLRWRTVFSYKFKWGSHINILELSAFLSHLRHRARTVKSRNERFYHILDSKVACGVITKGRSSSRRLNRVCRRIAALVLAVDTYPLILWTISGWNFSDGASRRFEAG